MPAEPIQTTVKGQVTDLFGHRFVLATETGKILADLGPKGADAVALAVGDEVTLTGEQKPSEVKVDTITVGGLTVALKSGKDDHKHDPDAEDVALAAVKAAGFEVVGSAKHKPKHFEILGRRDDAYTELHVELDGRIGKTKPGKAPKDEDRS